MRQRRADEARVWPGRNQLGSRLVAERQQVQRRAAAHDELEREGDAVAVEVAGSERRLQVVAERVERGEPGPEGALAARPAQHRPLLQAAWIGDRQQHLRAAPVDLLRLDALLETECGRAGAREPAAGGEARLVLRHLEDAAVPRLGRQAAAPLHGGGQEIGPAHRRDGEHAGAGLPRLGSDDAAAGGDRIRHGEHDGAEGLLAAPDAGELLADLVLARAALAHEAEQLAHRDEQQQHERAEGEKLEDGPEAPGLGGKRLDGFEHAMGSFRSHMAPR